jgi:hypothetical protein
VVPLFYPCACPSVALLPLETATPSGTLLCHHPNETSVGLLVFSCYLLPFPLLRLLLQLLPLLLLLGARLPLLFRSPLLFPLITLPLSLYFPLL